MFATKVHVYKPLICQDMKCSNRERPLHNPLTDILKWSCSRRRMKSDNNNSYQQTLDVSLHVDSTLGCFLSFLLWNWCWILSITSLIIHCDCSFSRTRKIQRAAICYIFLRIHCISGMTLTRCLCVSRPWDVMQGCPIWHSYLTIKFTCINMILDLRCITGIYRLWNNTISQAASTSSFC